MDYPSDPLCYIGTYTKTGSRGIYAARLNTVTGTLSAPWLAAETANPTFLALSPDRKFLYAVRSSPDMAAAFAVDAATGHLTPLSPPALAEAAAPCHAAVDRTGRALIVTNYHAGIVGTLPLLPGGGLGVPQIVTHHGRSADPVAQTGPHPHSSTFSPDNRFSLVCDLGLDRIFTYRFDPSLPGIEPAEPPFVSIAAGSGPRHFTFDSGGRRAYVISELANTITTYSYDTVRGALTPRQTVSTLPAGFAGKSAAAEIRLHPNGRFLYGSNRGHDSIACFAVDAASGDLTLLETFPSGGRAPRHFALSPDGAWLVCAHQNSDSLGVFRVEENTGRLIPTGGSIAVPMPVCVLFQGC